MYTSYVENINIPRPKWLGGNNWSLKNLKALTVILGKNGSGKSLLLRAWRDQDAEHIHYIIPERTGEITFEPGYLAEQMNGNGRSQRSQGNSFNNYRQVVITRIQSYFMARGNVRNGTLPGDPKDLEDLLSKLIPDFQIELTTDNPPYSLERLGQSEKITGIGQLSSGEAQLLTVALDVLTVAAMWDLKNSDKRIILVDEPDAHIHPDLQVRFADFLVEVSKKYKIQIVVATHSTTLLSAIGQFGSDNSCVLHLRKEISEFPAEPFNAVLKEISACLGGHALMGPLFGVPLLLVEGDDDYRIWSQIPRHHKVSFSVIPCGGDEIKKYQKSLEKVFSSLRNEKSISGYALLDGDKTIPVPSPEVPQDYIKFMGLQCHESENLYLADEVLITLGFTWDQAADKIIAEAENYGQKAGFLKEAKSWDRKNDDIKSVIEEISKILDPKNVHWTIRVAKKIGEEKPQGQLLDFLGNDVVNSLWPTT